MSLNVSCEILQQDRQVKAIHRRLTNKVLSTVKDLQSERPQDYRTVCTHRPGRRGLGGIGDRVRRQSAAVGLAQTVELLYGTALLVELLWTVGLCLYGLLIDSRQRCARHRRRAGRQRGSGTTWNYSRTSARQAAVVSALRLSGAVMCAVDIRCRITMRYRTTRKIRENYS
jgi:hypothetical protein